MINKDRFKYALLIIGICVIIFGGIKRILDQNSLMNNSYLVQAKFTKFSYGKWGPTAHYEYFYESIKINSSKDITQDIYDRLKKSGSDKLWIVISKEKPKINEILNNEEDFKKFNLNVSDTIKLQN